MTRWLVILDGSTDLEALGPAGKVLQAYADRAAIVEASGAGGLRAVTGVLSVTRGVPDETVLAKLDDGSRLFVEAWGEQEVMDKKRRHGEGLDWDAPGFDPP